MRCQGRRGITLIEVIVVLAVGLMVMGVLLPTVQAARREARQVSCVGNLRQVGLALHNYHAVYGSFPMSVVLGGVGHGVGQTCFGGILPFLGDDERALYNGLNMQLENWHPANRTASGTAVAAYICPENPNTRAKPAAKVRTADGAAYQGTTRFAPLHYGANWGGGRGAWGQDFVKTLGTCQGVIVPVSARDSDGRPTTNIRIRDILDGTAFTLAVVERRDSQGWNVGGWGGSEFDVNTSPASTGDDARARIVYTGSFHGDGVRAAMADGSVRVLPPTMAQRTWYSLITRSEGEVIAKEQMPPVAKLEPVTP